MMCLPHTFDLGVARCTADAKGLVTPGDYIVRPSSWDSTVIEGKEVGVPYLPIISEGSPAA
jgi:hypothetical protein